MRRAAVANVTCLVCAKHIPGVVMAAEPEGDESPWLVELCLGCLDQMFDVAKLLQMRLRTTQASVYKADYGPDWTKIHNEILDRDQWQCQDEDHQKVGGAELGESLLVHHIKPLKKFNGDYVSANQPANLITLCSLCHGRWHGQLRRAKVHK